MGGATNCDAYHMTDPRADGLGVASCIKAALRNADLDPEAINYINPHATRCLVAPFSPHTSFSLLLVSLAIECLGPSGSLPSWPVKRAERNLYPSFLPLLNLQAPLCSTLVGDIAEVKAMKQAFPNFTVTLANSPLPSHPPSTPNVSQLCQLPTSRWCAHLFPRAACLPQSL